MNPHEALTTVTSIPDPSFLNKPALPPKPYSNSSRLAPEDAFFARSPPPPKVEAKINQRVINGTSAIIHETGSGRRKREKDRGRSGSRRGKGEWKKLFLQHLTRSTDPDNYTDPPTFLSHLQRNPRLQPYDFWPLAADSTVIVQHLASVAIFVSCFVGINREQVSPVSVVSLGSTGTIVGWALWDSWVRQSEAAKRFSKSTSIVESEYHGHEHDRHSDQNADSTCSRPPSRESEPLGLGLVMTTRHSVGHNDGPQCLGTDTESSAPSAPSFTESPSTGQNAASSHSTSWTYHPPTSILSHRNQQRLETVKSAVLICCVLRGLSPILKSLTLSTSEDSIWALSSILMCINILFFDYGGGVGV
ncbi:MAG: hypothetical protein Q9224_003359, partial [Gallowayella concinna]